MKVLKSSESLRRALSNFRTHQKKVGFVPTMGFLHEGHLRLVRQAKQENDCVVVSIFVNPLQFGPKEDYKKYPRDMKRDSQLLKDAETDFLYAPDKASFYPSDFQTTIAVSQLTQGLCGKSRPTHFAGVTTVLGKLLHIVQPSSMYLGQKDYQQYRVVERMVQDLDMAVKVKSVGIVREADGLAMSSRNFFLSSKDRACAPIIYQALKRVKGLALRGIRDVKTLQKALLDDLKKIDGARVDYAEIVDAADLKNVVELGPRQKGLAACAVYFGKTRLIDNIIL